MYQWACQEWWEQTKDHNQWHVFIEWIDEFESPVVWSSCCCCPTIHSSIDRSMWASLATTSLHFLILFMRVGECLCEVFPARGGNLASVSFSPSLLENALEADLKWLLRRIVANWSGRFALSLFWVSVPFWDLRGDTLICDFDTCAYSCEGQSNWRAPNSQVRSDMQQLRRKVAHIHICAVELKTGPRFGVSSVKNWSKSSVKNWSKFFLLFFPQFYSVFGHF